MSEDAPIEHLRRLVASKAGKRDSFDATNNWDNPPAIMFTRPINRTMDVKARDITQPEFPVTRGYRGMSQEHAHSHIYGYDWTNCSLCRSSRQAMDTLNRTLRRRVDWSERPVPSPEDPLPEGPPVTREEALQRIVQLLGETARCCESYHRGAMRSVPCSPLSDTDSLHLRRYHTPQTLVTSHKTCQDTRLTVALPRGQYSLETVPCTLTDPPADRHVLINFSI